MTQTTTTWQGPCATRQAHPTDPNPATSWDLDVGDLRSWLEARRVCDQECPLLSTCLRQRLESYPTSNPRSVIWAGAAYSETGRLLDTRGLRRLYAVQRNRHRRGKPTTHLGAEQVA